LGVPLWAGLSPLAFFFESIFAHDATYKIKEKELNKGSIPNATNSLDFNKRQPIQNFYRINFQYYLKVQ